MQKLEIDLVGTQEALRMLRRLRTMEPFRPPMVRSLARVQGRVATYPPPLPHSTYRRIGRLGQGWSSAEVEVDPSEIRGTFGNSVEYGPYVQDEEYQAQVHRGRWVTDAQAIAQEERAIVGDFEQAIRGLVDGHV